MHKDLKAKRKGSYSVLGWKGISKEPQRWAESLGKVSWKGWPLEGFVLLEMSGKTLYPASQESTGIWGNRDQLILAGAQKIRGELCRTDGKGRLGKEADPAGMSGHCVMC